MADTKTVEGLGPLPKRPPRWRVVRFKAKVTDATAFVERRKAEAKAERDTARGEMYGQFSKRSDNIRDAKGNDVSDAAKAAATVASPIPQGAYLRPAGVNVPTGRLLRPDGSIRAIKYPFGTTKFSKKKTGILV